MKHHWFNLRHLLDSVFQKLVERFSYKKVLLVFSVICFCGGWFLGMLLGSGVFSNVFQHSLSLTKELESLQHELLESQKTIAEREISHQIDSLTLKKVSEAIKNLEYELAASERELKYYQSLMGDVQTSSKPFVKDVSLFNTEAGEIGYRIVVQQGKTSQGKTSEVKLQVAITGLTEQGMTTLPMTEFDPSFSAGEDAFSIKYYKLLEGHFMLPDTFEPEEIVTKTWVKGQKNQTTENRFNWQLTTPEILPESKP